MRMIRKILGYAVLLAGMIASASGNAFADDPSKLDDMNFAELVNSVDLGKQAELVQTFQDREAKNVLIKNRLFSEDNGCSIDAIRNREILVVTIPARHLFGPNSVKLLPDAGKYLDPFKRYLKDPDMYRVLAVMHTDNTGSDLYREEITIDRAEAISAWFEDSGVNTDYLFPFAMSDDIPLVPNDSFTNRDKNRRLEIYLVPGEKMLEKAKSGRITLGGGK